MVQGATAQELGLQDAAIFGAQIAVLQDPAALQEIRTLVRDELYAPESRDPGDGRKVRQAVRGA